ncbi:MAG: GTP-binding protein, partial [Alphaproteobacteria bacterium]
DVIEHKAAHETKHAMDFCHLAIVVVDAVQGIEKQDLSIVSDALAEGRPVILALNKWDQVPEDQKKRITRYIKTQSPMIFHDVATLPVVYLSAKEGKGVSDLFDIAGDAFFLILWHLIPFVQCQDDRPSLCQGIRDDG